MNKILFLYKLAKTADGKGTPPAALVNNGHYLSKLFLNVLKCNAQNIIDCTHTEHDIWKYVNAHTPNVLFLEGTWVSPAVLSDLLRTYTNLTIVVREHARLGFLAVDGSFVSWWSEYTKIKKTLQNPERLILSFNTMDTVSAMNTIYFNNYGSYEYLPNYYYYENLRTTIKEDLSNNASIKLSCFGSLRLMKNQLLQATAAIGAAQVLNKKLEFFMNAPHPDDTMNCVALNIKHLFQQNPKHKLSLVQWSSPDNLNSMLSQSDISLQASMTESFNFMTADSIVAGTPVIVSKSIDWITTEKFKVDTYHYDTMVQSIISLFSDESERYSVWKQQLNDLKTYNLLSMQVWHRFMEKLRLI